MREILFKAKREDNGEWVYGYYLFVKEQNKHYILTGKIASYSVDCSHSNLKTNGFEWFEVAPETVGQYTGLLDKNGKKIFENDILYAYGSYNLTVIWDNENARFYAEYKGRKSGHEDDDNDDYVEAEEFESYEIIGNTFDKESNQ